MPVGAPPRTCSSSVTGCPSSSSPRWRSDQPTIPARGTKVASRRPAGERSCVALSLSVVQPMTAPAPAGLRPEVDHGLDVLGLAVERLPPAIERHPPRDEPLDPVAVGAGERLHSDA